MPGLIDKPITVTLVMHAFYDEMRPGLVHLAGQVDFTKKAAFEDTKASSPRFLIADSQKGQFRSVYNPVVEEVPAIISQLKAIGDKGVLVWRIKDEVYAVTLQNWLVSNRPDLHSRLFFFIDP